MWKLFGIRISRNALISCCFVTCIFTLVVLVVHSVDRPSTTHYSSPPGIRSWQSNAKPEARPEMTFETSPYNWKNRNLITGSSSPGPSPPSKLILWDASNTLRIKSLIPQVFKDCPVRSCELSSNYKDLSNASAIVFDDHKIKGIFPPQLKPNTVFIYYGMRTASEISVKSKNEKFRQAWTSAFNWVWSYRLDSDIFQPFSYIKETINYKPLSMRTILGEKEFFAAWVNANPHGDTGNDVRAYLQQVETEAFSHKSSWTKSIKELDSKALTDVRHAFAKYYFIFAFEPMDCADYVSDVSFFAFDPRVQAVPVLGGSFKYARYFPEGAFVNAADFDSTQDLAKHLVRLASHKEKYYAMLMTKLNYAREEGLSNAWCQLCERLHRVDRDNRLLDRIDNIHDWIWKGGRCVGSNTTEAEKWGRKEI